jgi:hypothetical protein
MTGKQFVELSVNIIGSVGSGTVFMDLMAIKDRNMERAWPSQEMAACNGKKMLRTALIQPFLACNASEESIFYSLIHQANWKRCNVAILPS